VITTFSAVSANRTLDVLLELICLRIQLSATQDQRARDHYIAVSDWLSRVGSPVRLLLPHIFPQGSQRLGTTSKPVERNEFDLDAVCLLNTREPCHPGEIYRLIWDRLWEHGTYRPMMKRMPRCIRLEYSGDFHLDIAPAVPDLDNGGNVILVPDLDADLALDHPHNDEWKSTNPRDYAQWFEDRCIRPALFTEKYARAQVDPVPDPEPLHAKATLKRSVQLFKRWRDVDYCDRPSLAPPSIILTTLSGHLYRGEALCTNALTTILSGIVTMVENEDHICLTNPAHDGENICEKWENVPGSYRDFTNAVTAFRDRWDRLQHCRGFDEVEEELSALFGEAPVGWALREYASSHVIGPREKRVLGVQRGSGIVTVAPSAGVLPVRPHTYFGDNRHGTR
jgi:hypothetical protein